MLHAPLANRGALEVRKRHVTLTLLLHRRVDVPDILVGDGWDEALGLPRLSDFCVELVDLLEGEALCFVDQGPDEEDADEAAAAVFGEREGFRLVKTEDDGMWRKRRAGWLTPK